MPLDERYAFQKTDQGAQELNARSSILSAKQRRCLILADGRRTVRELAMCFRPGELAPLLRDLVERGFLEAPPEGPDAIEPGVVDVSLIDQVRFLHIQARAVSEINERVGPRGDALARDLEACGTPEQLRRALRDAERALQELVGADEASSFVKRIGKHLMGN
jgi:hypothetical protein